MVSDIAIKISNLSKCYQIYEQPHDRLKQLIVSRLQRLVGNSPKQYFSEFWAIKGLSLEILKGETIAIIGPNGSGKSTLLQLICGTCNPTSGSIQINGRIAALLELGAGFNPEFTGRENVYMTACLYGMTREKTNLRFAEIEAFADIGDFIEQPVKIYSSGMYVRLAFAIIAHVDADILVVDEALAVGDAVFTQKCMKFIRDFQKQGTILFVSHDMAAVENLCGLAVWLRAGEVHMIGLSKDVSEAYLQESLQEIYGNAVKLTSVNSDITNTCALKPEKNLDHSPKNNYGAIAAVHDNIEGSKGWETGHASIMSVTLEHVSKGQDGIFEGGELVCLKVRAKAHTVLCRPILGFLVRDRLGQDLFGENTLQCTSYERSEIAEGTMFEGQFEFRLPMLPNGQYALMTSVAEGDYFENIQHNWINEALIITVSSSKVRYGLVGLPFRRVNLEIIDD